MSGGPATPESISRRSLLAAGATALGATAGCVKRTRNVMAREPASQVSVRILTFPSDTNSYAIKIARELASNLEACGISAEIAPMSPEALFREVLLNHNFDIYVAQFHRYNWIEPDQLYGLLHSMFASEPGWQNPFGYTNLGLDESLKAQRTTSGSDRQRAINDVQKTISETQPFTTLAFPDALSTIRTDRFRDWKGSPTDPLTLLQLSPTEGGDSSTLQLATTDGRITGNRNPLAAEFRTRGTLIDLLYDPIGRRVDGVLEPWLATDWQVLDTEDGVTYDVHLREDLTWHDGTSLTAEDVAFTYRFLRDTSLGNADSPIPAPLYRGRVSLVDDAKAIDETTVRVQFADASPVVRRRAFTVPVLPKHIWAKQTDTAKVAGVETNRSMTEALAWNNPDAVGSGPLQFEKAIPGDSLRLSRYEDHFLHRDGIERPGDIGATPVYQELQLSAVGSDDAAVEMVASGEADATLAPLGTSIVPRIGRKPELDLVSKSSRAFYHVGYNVREAPLSNTRFRRVIGRLLDKQQLVQSVFDGYAKPATSPLAGTGWLAPGMEWNSKDPANGFIGSDGELNVTAAREAFVDAGYRYDDDKLLAE